MYIYIYTYTERDSSMCSDMGFTTPESFCFVSSKYEKWLQTSV